MCEPSVHPDRSHVPGALAALARWAVHRNRLVLSLAALFVLLTGLLSVGVSAHLGSGGWLAENTPNLEEQAPDAHPAPRTNTGHPATTSAKPSNVPRP